MKFLARLPDRKNYRSIPSNRMDETWYEDIASTAIRLRTKVKNLDPFLEQFLTVVIRKQQKKVGNTEHPYRLDFCLFMPSPDDLRALDVVTIEREVHKGMLFCWAEKSYVISLERPSGIKSQLIYSFN